MMHSLMLPAALGRSASAGAADADRRRNGTTLAAYFSRSGNTRVIAGVISRTLGAALFEIEPASPYPADYLETVKQAQQERDRNYEPALKATISDIAGYQTIYLCFPIWGETAPPVIRSFLTAHDLSAKTLVPVITHGGYGLGSSLAVLRSRAPKVRSWKVLRCRGRKSVRPRRVSPSG